MCFDKRWPACVHNNLAIFLLQADLPDAIGGDLQLDGLWPQTFKPGLKALGMSPSSNLQKLPGRVCSLAFGGLIIRAAPFFSKMSSPTSLILLPDQCNKKNEPKWYTYEAHNLNIMPLDLVWLFRRNGISASTHKTGKKLSNRNRTIDSMAWWMHSPCLQIVCG